MSEKPGVKRSVGHHLLEAVLGGGFKRYLESKKSVGPNQEPLGNLGQALKCFIGCTLLSYRYFPESYYGNVKIMLYSNRYTLAMTWLQREVDLEGKKGKTKSKY